MKPVIEILNYEMLEQYLKEDIELSLEFSKKGLMLTSKEISIRLLINLDELEIIDTQLNVFERFFKELTVYELAEAKRYL